MHFHLVAYFTELYQLHNKILQRQGGLGNDYFIVLLFLG